MSDAGVAAIVAKQRREQGLPPDVEDASALRAIATLVDARPRTGAAGAGNAA